MAQPFTELLPLVASSTYLVGPSCIEKVELSLNPSLIEVGHQGALGLAAVAGILIEDAGNMANPSNHIDDEITQMREHIW